MSHTVEIQAPVSARLFTTLLGYTVRAQAPLARPSFTVARLALGERMYRAGINDGETGEQIAAMDRAIRRRETTAMARADLQAERERLVLQLADAALVDDAPLPGADAEYAQVRKMMAVLPGGNANRHAWR